MSALRLKLDENVPVEAVDLFAAAGHDCDTVSDEGLAGAMDEDVATACAAERRVLVTLDLDFADLRVVSGSGVAGVIVLRPHEADRLSVLALVRRLIPVLEREAPVRSLWVVNDRRIRIREFLPER